MLEFRLSVNSITANKQALNELEQPIWSVISFDRHEARGLTYDEALGKLQSLDREHVPGLCIVTDEAAGRTHKP